jgi:hypothetical protein
LATARTSAFTASSDALTAGDHRRASGVISA